MGGSYRIEMSERKGIKSNKKWISAKGKDTREKLEIGDKKGEKGEESRGVIREVE